MSLSDWDYYFVTMAKDASRKSKDPSTKVGAVLVDPKNRVLSVSYNGFPRGIPDELKLLEDRNIKLRMTLHAELNGILFAQRSLEDCTIYVYPMPPCAQCAAAIIQAGIKRVVAPHPTKDQKERWEKDFALAEWAFAQAGVELVLFNEEKM